MIRQFSGCWNMRQLTDCGNMTRQVTGCGNMIKKVMETRFATSTGHGNMICNKYWLWEQRALVLQAKGWRGADDPIP